MASLKISTHNPRFVPHKGFTFIELLVVMALLFIIAGFGLIISMDNFRGYSFRTERMSIVSTLQKARGQAVSNMCFGTCTGGRPHGVYIGAHSYTIFQGDSYAARDVAVDEVVPARYEAMGFAAGSFTEIVFSQLSGAATPHPSGVTTLSLIDTAGKDSSVLTVNAEGAISWTN